MRRKLFIIVLACSAFPLNPGSAWIRLGLLHLETWLAGPQARTSACPVCKAKLPQFSTANQRDTKWQHDTYRPTYCNGCWGLYQSQGIIETWTLEIPSPGTAARHQLPSDVVTAAIHGGSRSAGAQLSPPRSELKLLFFIVFLWLLSLSKHSCWILLEEKVKLTPLLETFKLKEKELGNSEIPTSCQVTH